MIVTARRFRISSFLAVAAAILVFSILQIPTMFTSPHDLAREELLL
jgi:hypothetical protein